MIMVFRNMSTKRHFEKGASTMQESSVDKASMANTI
jgi:hypothetical protein